MKKIFFISTFIIISLFSLIIFQKKDNSLALFLYKSYESKNVAIGDSSYVLYVSDTQEKRTQGLSGLSKLNSNEGMIFMMDKKDQYSFWMKDMLFPLDFIYIDNNEVVYIIENVLPESYPEYITSSKPADIIIELNAGEVAKNKVKIGNIIEY